MPGRQVAWLRTCDGGFLGVVLVVATSANRRSRVTMQLWLPARRLHHRPVRGTLTVSQTAEPADGVHVDSA